MTCCNNNWETASSACVLCERQYWLIGVFSHVVLMQLTHVERLFLGAKMLSRPRLWVQDKWWWKTDWRTDGWKRRRAADLRTHSWLECMLCVWRQCRKIWCCSWGKTAATNFNPDLSHWPQNKRYICYIMCSSVLCAFLLLHCSSGCGRKPEQQR